MRKQIAAITTDMVELPEPASITVASPDMKVGPKAYHRGMQKQ